MEAHASSNLARLERDIDRLLAAQRARAASARSAQLRRNNAPLVREAPEYAASEGTPALSTTVSASWSDEERYVEGDYAPSDDATAQEDDSGPIADDHPSGAGHQRRRPRRWPQLPQGSAEDYVETLLGQELSEERSRRLRAEEAARKLTDELERHIQRAQAGDHR